MRYKNVLLVFSIIFRLKSEVKKSFSYITSYLSKENILTRFQLYVLLSKL